MIGPLTRKRAAVFGFIAVACSQTLALASCDDAPLDPSSQVDASGVADGKTTDPLGDGGDAQADTGQGEGNEAAVKPDAATGFHFEEIALSTHPLAMTELKFIPNRPGEFLVLGKAGEISHYELLGNAAMLVATYAIDGVDSSSDCGLLSMAFDPNFAESHLVYLGYCIDDQTSRIAQHMFDPTSHVMSPSGTEIVTVGTPEASSPWHNVGSMGFGPDQNLWALFGDKTVDMSAQDTTNLLGSLIRITPHKDAGGYDVPADNPFVGSPSNDPAIIAYGIRSPWRGHLDSRGRFWFGDVGDATNEEVDVLTVDPGGHKPKNFGWPYCEGPCTQAVAQPVIEPIFTWNRSRTSPYAAQDPETPSTSRRVVWVGPEYRNRGNDRYSGALFDTVLFGDFCAGWVRAARADDDGGLLSDERLAHLEGITAWDQGPDGYLYAVTYGNCNTFPYEPGRLFRLVKN